MDGNTSLLSIIIYMFSGIGVLAVGLIIAWMQGGIIIG